MITYPVPADLVEELVPWFKEGYRAGETRNVMRPRIAGEVRRLENLVALKMGKLGIVDATAALRDAQKKLAAYERGFNAGQKVREKLKGGL